MFGAKASNGRDAQYGNTQIAESRSLPNLPFSKPAIGIVTTAPAAAESNANPSTAWFSPSVCWTKGILATHEAKRNPFRKNRRLTAARAFAKRSALNSNALPEMVVSILIPSRPARNHRKN
jgi:hypothetical protein